MSRWIRTVLVVLLVLGISPALQVQAQTDPGCLYSGEHSNGALYCITMPPPAPPYGMWNGDLVIFAHGYVAVNEPLAIPWSQMSFSDGQGNVITMPFLVNSMGYAFATTSYSRNGLAVIQGLADVRELAALFKAQFPSTQHVYLIGASEGGLVTTQAIEKAPLEFSGGLALCGPIGNFRSQINYWGDFRVLYDYFFPAARYPSIQIPTAPWISIRWLSGRTGMP